MTYTMKDSGIEWIGMIPEHWKIKRVKDVAKIQNGFAFDSKTFSEKNGIPVVRQGDIGKEKTKFNTNIKNVDSKFVLNYNDNIVGMSGEFKIEKNKIRNISFLNQRVCKIYSKKHCNDTYLYYYCKISLKNYQNSVFYTTIPNLSTESFYNIIYTLPPKKEQEAIASYLDKHVGALDKYIVAAEKKIKLLAEQKTSLIYETITRGLNPDVKMKDSGIEWIGMIPEHWKIERVKDLFHKMPKGHRAARSDNEDGIYDFYTSGKKIKKSDTFDIDDSLLLLTTGGSFHSYYVTGKFSYSTDVMALKAKEDLMQKYLFYYLKSVEERYNHMFFYGTGLKHLQTKNFLSSPFPVPSKKEQEIITSYLDEKCYRIDKERELLIKKVALLKEYKTSLIFETVTGKRNI